MHLIWLKNILNQLPYIWQRNILTRDNTIVLKIKPDNVKVIGNVNQSVEFHFNKETENIEKIVFKD